MEKILNRLDVIIEDVQHMKDVLKKKDHEEVCFTISDLRDDMKRVEQYVDEWLKANEPTN